MRTQDAFMELEHLPLMPGEKIGCASPLSGPVQPPEKVIAEAERGAILHALQEKKGNRTKAAVLPGISMRSLFYHIEEYCLKDD